MFNAFFPKYFHFFGLHSFLCQLAEQGIDAPQALQVQKVLLVCLNSLLYQSYTCNETASTVLAASAVISI